jgi:hypothetical protein
MRSSVHPWCLLRSSLSNILCKLQGGIERVTKKLRGNGAAAEVRCDYMIGPNFASISRDQHSCHQFNFDSPTNSAVGTYGSEINKWRALSADVSDQRGWGGGSLVVFGHNGKPHLYRWDSKQSCYVLVDESSPGEAA